MTMEPPSPEDVAEVAAGLRRASLDLVEVWMLCLLVYLYLTCFIFKKEPLEGGW